MVQAVNRKIFETIYGCVSEALNESDEPNLLQYIHTRSRELGDSLMLAGRCMSLTMGDTCFYQWTVSVLSRFSILGTTHWRLHNLHLQNAGVYTRAFCGEQGYSWPGPCCLRLSSSSCDLMFQCLTVSEICKNGILHHIHCQHILSTSWHPSQISGRLAAEDSSVRWTLRVTSKDISRSGIVRLFTPKLLSWQFVEDGVRLFHPSLTCTVSAAVVSSVKKQLPWVHCYNLL